MLSPTSNQWRTQVAFNCANSCPGWQINSASWFELLRNNPSISSVLWRSKEFNGSSRVCAEFKGSDSHNLSRRENDSMLTGLEFSFLISSSKLSCKNQSYLITLCWIQTKHTRHFPMFRSPTHTIILKRALFKFNNKKSSSFKLDATQGF